MADIQIIMEVLGKNDVLKAAKATDKLESDVRALNKRFKEGNISQSDYMRGMNQLASKNKQVGGGYKNLQRAVFGYAKQVDKAQKENNEFARSANQAANAQDRLSSASRRGSNQFASYDTATYKANQQTKRFASVGLQQAGYQVGDFAVQLQSGTNAAVAFGQQGSQLLGIFGPLGALLGAGLAIGTAVVAPLLDAEKAANKAADGLGNFEEKLKSAKSEVQSMREALELLASGFDTTFEKTLSDRVGRAKEDLSEAKEALDDAVRAAEAAQLTGRGGGFMGLLSGVGGASEAVTDAEKSVQQAKLELAVAQELLRQQEQMERNESVTNQLHEARIILRKQEREQSEKEAEVAGRIRAAYREYYRSRRAGAAIVAREEAEAQERVESAFRQYQQSRIAGENAMRRAGALTAEQLMRSIPLLERMGTLDTSSTVNQINKITTALQISTRQAIRLARSLPGYTSGGVSGPDGAVAQSQELLGQGTTLTPDFDFADPSAGGGGSASGGAAQAAQEVDKLNDSLSRNQQLLQDVGKTMSQSFGDALMSIVDGTKSAADAFKDMARQILKQAFDMLVVKPIMDSIMGFFGGSQISGPSFGMGSRANFAPPPRPFADGGVVNGPTVFPMANGTGLMGEAGPEAIMPLKRGKNGKLGVQSEGGSGDVNVTQVFNINGNGDEYILQKIKQQAPKIANYAQQQFMDRRQRGGAVKATFG